jgi:hypothetical protein
VVEVACLPEEAAKDFKEYSSRALNRAGLDSRFRKRWSRSDSARRILDRDALGRAIHYVVEKQGEPMAVFVAPRRASGS